MPISERAKKTIMRIRTCVFWTALVLILVIVASTLLFPYDRVAEQVIVDSASRTGLDVDIEDFDFRFPNTVVCGGVTVTPRGKNSLVGETYWETIECTVSLKPLMDKKIDVQRFRGTLDTQDSDEGKYNIDGELLAVPGSGTAGSRQTITIRSLTVRGEKVNLELSGNVSTTGSLNSTDIDLSADIRRLDRATSADKTLSTMFMAMKFAMAKAGSGPPVRLRFSGVGTDVDVDRLPPD